MHLSATVLGTTAARSIATNNQRVILTIGRDRFYRSDLAVVGCFNYLAAAALSRALEAHAIRDTAAVFATIAPADLALPGIGPVALAVLGAAFEARGIGGEAPLEAWVQRHLATDAVATTFSTIKRHRTAADEATAAPRRGRRSPPPKPAARRHAGRIRDRVRRNATV